MRIVLVVDHDQSSRIEVLEMVERRGLTARWAKSLAEAQADMKRKQPDLVIVNATMPRGSAIDLLPYLPTKQCPRVVVLDEDPLIGQVIEKTRSQLVRWLPKPVDPHLLRPILNEVLRAGRRLFPGRRRVRPLLFDLMLGNSQAMQDVFDMIQKVAPTDATVMISGETGTGKEVVARSIHERSQRKDKKFVAINCGAIPENLVESELFGHVKGAFTGADKTRRGVFERANGGTLFLDEITEMSPDMQVRLLRVLETGVITRVGSEKEQKVDVRVVAATNRDTAVAVDADDFREDLMYRLAVFPIKLPPVRQRGHDVVLLAEHFLTELNRKQGTSKQLGSEAEQRLKTYHWPGNVRQLRNIMHRSFIMESDEIELECLTGMIHDQQPLVGNEHADADASNEPRRANGEADIELNVGTSISEAEHKLVISTLEHYAGDKKKAAEVLGISLKTLYNRLNEYEQKNLPQQA